MVFIGYVHVCVARDVKDDMGTPLQLDIIMHLLLA